MSIKKVGKKHKKDSPRSKPCALTRFPHRPPLPTLFSSRLSFSHCVRSRPARLGIGEYWIRFHVVSNRNLLGENRENLPDVQRKRPPMSVSFGHDLAIKPNHHLLTVTSFLVSNTYHPPTLHLLHGPPRRHFHRH